MQQQDPRLMQVQLTSRLSQLQSALVQTTNPTAQQQLLAEINAIQTQLGQLGQMINQQQQQPGYYPNQQPQQYQPYTPPNTGYMAPQQQQQQPMVPYQVPGNTFQPIANANTSQPNFAAMTGATPPGTSKYTQRKRKYDTYDTQYDKPPTQENIPAVENTTPILGSEYPPLVSSNLSFKKKIIGDKYKYNITGEETMNNLELGIDILSNSDEDILVNMHIGSDVVKSDIGNYLESSLLNNNKGTVTADIVNTYNVVTNKGTDIDAYFNLIHDTMNLAHIADRLKSKDDCMLYNKLDVLLAKELTKYLKHVGGLDAVLVTLSADYKGFEDYINGITDIETKRRITSATDILHKSLIESIRISDNAKETVLTDIDTDFNYYAVPIVDKTTVMYTVEPTLVEVLSLIEDQTLAITKTSYESLFNMITKVRNSNTIFSRTNKCIMMIATGVYEVYYNSYVDYYTILKR